MTPTPSPDAATAERDLRAALTDLVAKWREYPTNSLFQLRCADQLEALLAQKGAAGEAGERERIVARVMKLTKGASPEYRYCGAGRSLPISFDDCITAAELIALCAAPNTPTPADAVRGAEDFEPNAYAAKQTNESLVDAALQVYARSCMYNTEKQHEAAMIYRAEILRRLAAPVDRAGQLSVTEEMVERAWEAFHIQPDSSVWAKLELALEAAMSARAPDGGK